MKGFIKDIEDQAKSNSYFRQVLETGKHTQVVIMSIPPGGEIGEEVHPDNDQILYFVEGEGGDEDLKIITTYSPPHHSEATVHKTKEEADKAGY